MQRRDGPTAFRGAVAGMISAGVLQPLEVLKINLIVMPKQFSETKRSNFLKQFFQAIQIIYREERLAGFYRGNIPLVLSSGMSAAIFFSFLRRFEALGKKHNLNEKTNNFFSSATARALASVFVNPLNVWKTRAEVLGMNEFRSAGGFLRSLMGKEGMGGLFKGSFLMILRDFPFGGIFYVTYKATAEIGKRFTDSDMVYLMSGLFSGIVATMITHPIEIALA